MAEELTREQIESIRRSVKWNAGFHDGIAPRFELKEIIALCDMALSRTPSPPLRQDQEELRRVIDSIRNWFPRPQASGRTTVNWTNVPVDEARYAEIDFLLTAASLSLAPEPILNIETKDLVDELYKCASADEVGARDIFIAAAKTIERLSAAREAVLDQAVAVGNVTFPIPGV